MKRILLTGMSGTGKSSVIEALRARGYHAVDMDEPGWSEVDADGRWVWCRERVAELLGREEEGILFLSGCDESQGQFYPQFDHIILLHAPAPVIVERLKTRTSNDYGKRPEELAETLEYIETVEPRLRAGADHEIDTTLPLDDVVAMVLAIAGVRTPGETPR